MPIHIHASPEELAEFVLLPGDPDRAAHIASNFLDGASRYNSYRHLYGYTGFFEGTRVSVQCTGMGSPSAAIVCHELLQLGARVFLRVGTCGALQPRLQLGELIAVNVATPLDGATRDLLGAHISPVADFGLLSTLVREARTQDLPVHVGPVGTCDLFYDPRPERFQALERSGLLALEMESSMVLASAANAGQRAASLLTVSDIIATQRRADPKLLARSVDAMIELALRSARQFLSEQTF
ncbi:MAG: purine-nucleoside phosphorylase [Myxococcota bacterium]|jgi:purine-nucleoside phosphorylase|nr:purine-nucleoside phosphorylase [Myxococcota bacterium]